jgi:RNA polymerase sigma-70 factor (ECF subfamily)
VQNDQELLREIAAGSAEALGALYDAHGRAAYILARRILGKNEDAEEVVQDVFAQVWRDAGRYDQGRASVAGWLVMLTRTRAIDRLRSRRARPDLDQASDPAPALASAFSAAASPESLAVSSADARRVDAALAVLPPDQRSLIDLAYFEGFSQSEIAAKTGTPLGTVKTRMRAALSSLRAAIQS